MKATPTTGALLLTILMVSGCIILTAPLAVAQTVVTGSLEGVVWDRMSEKPVEGAQVIIRNAESKAVNTIKTDRRGRFFVGLLAPGEYELELSAPSYERRRLRLVATSTNKTKTNNENLVDLGVILLTPMTALPANTTAETNQEFAKLDFGSYYALVIGNNNYPKFRRLKNAVSDAIAVDTVLREKYSFQTKLLIDAKGQEIISAINYYKRTLTERDNFLIYYSGHGVKDADEAYWVPVDATDADDNTTWVSSTVHVIKNLKNTKAKHILVVSDSCFAGAIDLRELVLEEATPTTERERYLRKLIDSKSRVLIASGGDEPVLDIGGGKYSIFAKAFLEGLEKMDKPVFTAAELFRGYIEQQVSGNAKQTPELRSLRDSGHDNGYFVFVRKK